jgi:hypothetical protein
MRKEGIRKGICRISGMKDEQLRMEGNKNKKIGALIINCEKI